MCCCCIVHAVCEIPIAHICDNCYRIVSGVNVRPVVEPHHKASVDVAVWSVAELNIPLAIIHNDVSVSGEVRPITEPHSSPPIARHASSTYICWHTTNDFVWVRGCRIDPLWFWPDGVPSAWPRCLVFYWYTRCFIKNGILFLSLLGQ